MNRQILLKIYLVCCLYSINSVAQSFVISTYAGSGSVLGDGGQANAANVSWPSGIASDNLGNVYVADWGNSRIRKVDHITGIITTIAGNGIAGSSGDGGLATSAEFLKVYAIALDNSNNIYIADQMDMRVRVVNSGTGIITAVAGDGSIGFAGDGGLATSASLNGPSSVFIDDIRGYIYIADLNNHRIRRVNKTTGIINTIVGNGVSGFSGDGGSAAFAQISFPGGVLVDIAGNIYIADYGNNRIRKINASNGFINTFAGTGVGGFSGDGGQATAAELFNPVRMAFDSSENIMYVSDRNNNRIRKINMISGIINTVAGNGVYSFSGDGGDPLLASLANPNDVCVDGSGSFYIADQWNDRIRKVALIVGVHDFSANFEINIFPNPSVGILNIKTEEEIKTIIVNDIIGNEIYKSESQFKTIDLSSFPQGIYFLTIKTAKGVAIKKIVKS